VAGLFGATLAGAPPASALSFVHSAKSGQLSGGRLVLHGVNRHVTWFTGGGRSGRGTVTRVHRGVFLPGKPATGVLHVAGNRGGDELSFRLSQPRYSAARRTVSYRARQLNNARLPAGFAAKAITPTFSQYAASTRSAASTRFGASSLTVTSHPTVAPSAQAGNQCNVDVEIWAFPPDNKIWLYPQTYTAWDTDAWTLAPDQAWHEALGVRPYGTYSTNFWYISTGGDLRGCSNTVVFEWISGDGFGVRQDHVRPGTFTITTTWPWGQGPTSTCNGDQNYAVMDGNDGYACQRADFNGQIRWKIVPH